ncbi:ankyrin repeat and SOCS box protein 16 isoform X2 [Tyto alba]|uniref:ankyrin repeat and SOCS box protein 16 isoform X2 n=1 Tax=Tyto alba TaxID=56313 RepID=UPI001C676F30|nr:ankyrin repeat and SOCS box protein 16 isoform X2 [Tyto alba]
MAQETFAFTSSALRSLRLQRELLEQEDRRRALARESATRRFLPASPRPPLTPPRRPQYCRDPAVHNALYTGDLLRVKSIFKDEATANLIMETVSEELVWSPEQGLWVLSPRRQQTSALRIAAARGYGDCARHLLLRGAEVDAVVGGQAPLHDSAAAPRPDCARLLLAFGADPNVLSAEGSAPLHLCTSPDSLPCAELLLAHGARVNLGTRDRQATALHVASRRGLVAHVELYLRHGADPSRRTRQGETPLNAACAAAERPEDAGRYHRVAERLLEAGADPGAAGRKDHTPLHHACGNGQPRLVRLLLRHGAEVTVPNCAGYTPMDCALHAVEEYRHQRPEETIALLLDHGAGPVHPKVGDLGLGWGVQGCVCVGGVPRGDISGGRCSSSAAGTRRRWKWCSTPTTASPRPRAGWGPCPRSCGRSTGISTPRRRAWRDDLAACSTSPAAPSGGTWGPAATPLSPSCPCHPPCAATSSCPSRGSSPERGPPPAPHTHTPPNRVGGRRGGGQQRCVCLPCVCVSPPPSPSVLV